jgi:hypothetical protein
VSVCVGACVTVYAYEQRVARAYRYHQNFNSNKSQILIFSRDHSIGDTIPACIRDHRYLHPVLEPLSDILPEGPREYGTGRHMSLVAHAQKCEDVARWFVT